MDLDRLGDEFPRNAVSWRAQSVTKDGSKALALAYIDARDVMGRLDEVCGPANWEDSYVETAKGRVIATIRIRTDDGWVSKSDGAGDTDVEGDKGGISDAFKRAAVKWKIGRYLYAVEAPWVPCESYETEYQGKKKIIWKRWTVDPWSMVRGAPVPPKASARPTDDYSRKSYDDLAILIDSAPTQDELAAVWKQNQTQIKQLPDNWRSKLQEYAAERKAELTPKATPPVDPNDQFNRMEAAE